MISTEYKEDLLNEEINSMKQLDRIEFEQKINKQENSLFNTVILQFMCMLTLLILCFFFIIYDIGITIILFFTTFLTIIFCVISFVFFKYTKKYQEQNEIYIKEHTK